MDRKKLNSFRILLAATSIAWVYRILSVVVTLITLPLILSHLGKTEFGIWVLVGQAVSFLTLSDLGVATAVGRLLARFRGMDDPKAVEQLLSTVLAMLIAAGFIVALITLLVSLWISNLLGIEVAYAKVAQLVFVISGLSLASQFPLRIGMGILTGHQLYGPHAIGKILRSILYLIGILLLVALNALNLVSLAMVSAVTTLVAQIVLMAVAWYLTGPWSLSLRNISFGMAREILSLGSSTLCMSFTNLIYHKGIVIAVGRLLGLEAVGIYGVASSVINSVSPFISALATPFTTLASEWQARGQLEPLRRTYKVVMRVTAVLVASAAAGLFIYGESAISVWLSQGNWTAADFGQAGQTIWIMSLGLAVGLPQNVSRSILQGVGQHWKVSLSHILASFASLSVAILTMCAGAGIVGAALGWSLGQILQGVFYLAMGCYYLKQSIIKTALNVYPWGIAVGFAILLLAWGFRFWLVPNNVSNLLIGVGVCSVSGGMVAILISGQSRILWSRMFNSSP